MTALLVVPARGGSVGLTGKNLRRVCGVTLTGHAVRTGLASLRLAMPPGSRLVVDTDDPSIAAEGRAWGAEVPFLRHADLARDTSSTAASVIGLLDRLLESEQWSPEHVVLLQPTSPLRALEDVLACWEAHTRLLGRPSFSVTSSRHAPGKSLVVEGGVVRWAFGRPPARRQDAPPLVAETGSVYVITPDELAREQAFVVEGRSTAVPQPADRSLDVDDELDLLLAQAVYRARQVQQPRDQLQGAVLMRTSELGAAAAPPVRGRPVLVELDTDLHHAVPRLDSMLGDRAPYVTTPPSDHITPMAVEGLRDAAALLGGSPCWSLPEDDPAARRALDSHGIPATIRTRQEVHR